MVARDAYGSFLLPLVVQSALLIVAGTLVALAAWNLLRRRAARRSAPVVEAPEPRWPPRQGDPDWQG